MTVRKPWLKYHKSSVLKSAEQECSHADYSSWLTKKAAIQSVSNFISTFTDVITAAHCLRTLSYLVSFSGVKIWWPESMCSSVSSIVLKAAIQAGSKQLQVLTDIVFSLCLVFFCATRGILFVQFPILSSQKERHFVHSKTPLYSCPHQHCKLARHTCF